MTIALVLQVLQHFKTWDGVKVGGHQRHQDDPQRTPEGQRGADMVRSSTLYIYGHSLFTRYTRYDSICVEYAALPCIRYSFIIRII